MGWALWRFVWTSRGFGIGWEFPIFAFVQPWHFPTWLTFMRETSAAHPPGSQSASRCADAAMRWNQEDRGAETCCYTNCKQFLESFACLSGRTQQTSALGFLQISLYESLEKWLLARTIMGFSHHCQGRMGEKRTRRWGSVIWNPNKPSVSGSWGSCESWSPFFFKVFFSSYSRLLNHMKRPYRGMRMEILFIFDAGSSTGLSLTTETEGVQCKFARQLRGLFSAPM